MPDKKPIELENKKYWLLLYGLAVGVLFDILFYNKTLGISYLIFISFIILVFVLIFRGSFKKLNNLTWLFMVPIFMLSLTFFLYSNPVLKILNSLVVPLLVIVFCSLVSGINKSDWSDIRFLGDIIKRIFIPFGFIHKPFVTLSRVTSGSDSKSRVLPKIALGILIAVPILAIIIWLLSSADVIFKDLFLNIPLSKIIKHFLVVVAVTIYGISFLWALLKAFDERGSSVYGRIKWKLFLDPVVLLTVLVLINIIYIIFSTIQFAYLFGGSNFILPSAYSFAEYARRGFFELVTVSIINFGILLFGITFVKKERKKIFNSLKVLLTFFVLFTFVLLISAFYRMLLYEQAFGFTYLRIFVQAFMVMLLFLFIINIAYIWYLKLPIIKSYLIVSLAVYIVLNFINVDAVIAGNNINRYEGSGEIDIDYLKGLSHDAVPQMQRLIITGDEAAAGKDKEISAEVLEHFRQRNTALEDQKSWQSFNISRYRAEVVIEDNM